ncbi:MULTISPECIES: NB-ARC domain-containing protein [unclassified Tolypothrix]|uniref:NB-ARC domain-containing protein n=1 Tax=unclassified Tolypothrix TaxID=2649714 RepID=UPI0005EAB410|nr:MULTISPECIES: NB-ARC domain-containing protein [unclassified Tolypothrix]BAY88615.1 WD repeat protein [Microchaete diplosiphon NIES-3275]EKE97214.1 putative WD-40 repeat protein [Tolypothrix sp. PCC 7601]MBE9086120.1 hypothetical protein [Tolypothrix sp. LEGE 11397]UYD29286.1 hypothetical protein HGR01_15335 [Tolypothrix sp. PCC 7712]UYD34806.1 hypothetical protein HG267_03010 [Tolypothrix sp. PCC 7601]
MGITGKSRRVGVQGMGGIGKTVLATALARDEEVRKAFPDGVLWVTFGQTPQILTWQSYLASALGEKQAAFTEVGLAKARLRELFAQKACLLIVDDIWRLDDATAFDVLGERCQMLITTRDGAIVTGLGGEEYQLAVLGEQQALELLADWANQPEILQPSPHNDVTLQVARECGYLPLALAMVGAMMRGKPANRWQNILEKLRCADLEKIKQQFPDYPYPDLLKAIAVSVAALDENCQQRYLDFAVFPEDTPIPEAVLQTFWQPLGLDEFDSQDVIDELVSKSLALRDEAGNLRLHDLQFDYVRKQYKTLATESEGIGVLHNRLLNAYSKKYPAGWHSLENDGYIWQNLAYHLLAGGREGELQQLLCDFRWLQGKLENININELIADYNFLPEDENLQLIQGALRLSAHVLAVDKKQLSSQLQGRLLDKKIPEIQALLTQAKQQTSVPWLSPLTASLTPPGGRLLRNLKGENPVAVTPDGKLLISGSDDNTLKIWNLETGEETLALTGHTKFITAVAVTPNGKYIISSSGDRTIKVWEINTGQLVFTLTGHTSSVNAVAVTSDSQFVISGSSDTTVKIWNLNTGNEFCTLGNLEDQKARFLQILRSKNKKDFDFIDAVYSVVVTPDCKQVIAGYDYRTIRVWNIENKTQVSSWKCEAPLVRSLALALDGKLLIAASGANTIQGWSLDTGKEVLRLEGHNRGVTIIAITSDGKRLISYAFDKTFKYWNIETGEEILAFKAEDKNIKSIVLTPDNKNLISGSNIIKIWSLEINNKNIYFSEHNDSIQALAITPDGRKAISCSDDKTMKFWNLESQDVIRTFNHHTYSVNAIAVTADNKKVILGSDDKTLRVRELSTGKEILKLTGHSQGIIALAVTLDGQKVISSSGDHSLKIWDLKSGKEIFNIERDDWVHYDLAISPNDKYVISALYKIIIFDNISNIPESFIIDGHTTNYINAVAVTPDGMQVISASNENIPESFIIDAHTTDINAVAVTPDGMQIISASNDKTIKVWNMKTRKENFTLTGHTNDVKDLAVTTDSKKLISVSSDNTLQVWNLETAENIAIFTSDSSINCCAVAPDGVTIVAGDALGRLHFLRLQYTKE